MPTMPAIARMAPPRKRRTLGGASVRRLPRHALVHPSETATAKSAAMSSMTRPNMVGAERMDGAPRCPASLGLGFIHCERGGGSLAGLRARVVGNGNGKGDTLDVWAGCGARQGSQGVWERKRVAAGDTSGSVFWYMF